MGDGALMGAAALPAAMIATAVIAAGTASYAGYEQAETQDQQAKAAKKQAEFREALAAENARRQQEANARAMGALRAKFGAQGVDFTEGSALKVLEEEAVQGDLARREIIAKGQADSGQLGFQSDLYANQAGQARVATGLNTTSSLLASGAAYESSRQDRIYREKSLAYTAGRTD